MNKAVFISFILISPFFHAQQIKQFTFSLCENIDVWKPYNSLNEDSDLNPKRKSNTFTVSALYTIVNRKQIIVKAGPAFKIINYKVEDRIESFKSTHKKPGVPPHIVVPPQIIYLPTDFFSRSLNLGLQLTLERKFNTAKLMTTGLTMEAYCFEFYKAYYEDHNQSDLPTLEPSVGLIKDVKHLSNVNASVFYSYHLINRHSFSAALKLSLGMNFYSDWDQFEKYAWIGAGLEIGLFGRKKDKVKPE